VHVCIRYDYITGAARVMAYLVVDYGKIQRIKMLACKKKKKRNYYIYLKIHQTLITDKTTL